jgi:hypothetical protein
LRAHFSGVMEGELDGHYVRASYSDRPFDNETAGGRALLIRRVNPRSMLALGASYDEVSYVSGGAPSGLDFNRREGFFRTEIAGTRTEINLEVGYASVKGQTVDDGGALLRATLNRRITPTLSGFVNAVREYPTSEDVARSLDSTVTTAADLDSGLFTAGPRQTTEFEGGFRYVRTRSQAEISYAHREEQALVGAVGERVVDVLSTQLTRRFTPATHGRVFAALSKEDYSGTLGDFDELIAGLEFGMAFGPSLGLDLRVEHRNRDGSNASGDYSEFAGGLFLRYSGGAGQRATR